MSASGGGERGNRDKLYVKNKFMAGDAQPFAFQKLDQRSMQPMTAGEAQRANTYLSFNNGSPLRSAAGNFKQDLRIRNPRAYEIYGNRKKILKQSYTKPRLGLIGENL